MNTGETAAAELYQRALGGTFHLEAAVARTCAANFLRFADTLDSQLRHSHRIHALGGFGTFDSARQLRRGFESKAGELTETLTGLQDSAQRMAAAYLLAAGLIQEADASNARALQAVAAGLNSPG